MNRQQAVRACAIVAGAALSVAVLGPPIQAQDNTPLAQVTDLRARAEAGDLESQITLGTIYYVGLLGVQDYAEAARWFHLAAAQTPAQVPNRLWSVYSDTKYSLGNMYAMGQGVPRDFVEAHMWASLAASHLSGAAREQTVTLLDGMVTVMTPAEISEAQRRAREWHATHLEP